MSPSRGPLVTTSMKTDDMRPRNSSGVTVWLMIERETALTESAAPAMKRKPAASQSEDTSPAPAMASPQATTA